MTKHEFENNIVPIFSNHMSYDNTISDSHSWISIDKHRMYYGKSRSRPDLCLTLDDDDSIIDGYIDSRLYESFNGRYVFEILRSVIGDHDLKKIYGDDIIDIFYGA